MASIIKWAISVIRLLPFLKTLSSRNRNLSSTKKLTLLLAFLVTRSKVNKRQAPIHLIRLLEMLLESNSLKNDFYH
jgi:hypothetical protein